MELIKLENLPHVCSLEHFNQGSIHNCGHEFIPDYGFFYFDYSNPQFKNSLTITMHYQFKLYEFKLHECYMHGSYCDIRNCLNNVLRTHFKYKQEYQNSCTRNETGFVDYKGLNCYGETFRTQNIKRLFQNGFHEAIGYGYYVTWRLQELLKFDFTNYILPDDLKKNDVALCAYNENKRNLETIFLWAAIALP